MTPVKKMLIEQLLESNTLVLGSIWPGHDEYHIDGKNIIKQAKEKYGVDLTPEEIIEVGDEWINGKTNGINKTMITGPSYRGC